MDPGEVVDDETILRIAQIDPWRVEANQRVLDAAIELCDGRGVANTRIDDIRAQAAVGGRSRERSGVRRIKTRTVVRAEQDARTSRRAGYGNALKRCGSIRQEPQM